MQINRKPLLLPMGKQGFKWDCWFGGLGTCACVTLPGKGSHLNDLICAFSVDTEPLVIFLPPSPSSCCVPLLCLSKFLLSFHPFSLVFFFLLDDKDSSSTGSQGSSWPCESTPAWPASLITAQWLESLFCLQLQICKCYCIHVQRKYERLLLDRSLMIFL